MSFSRRQALVLLGSVAGLAGCGYRPLYGSSKSGADLPITEFEYIRLVPIPERHGQLTYNYLSNRLNPRGRPVQPRYVLQVSVARAVSYTISSSDQTENRGNLSLDAFFILKAAGSGTELYRSRARTVASFDVLESQYASDVAAGNATERAAETLSDEIVQRLGLYFSRIRQTPTPPAG